MATTEETDNQQELRPHCGLVFLKSYGWLFLLVALLTCMKLVLVAPLLLTAMGGSVYDDQLFLSISQALVDGKWLGEYDARLLIKGPGYPIFLAVNDLLGLPLLTSQQLFYSGACLLFLAALVPLVKSRLLLVLLAGLLIFNPHTFDIQMLRANREGIYHALTIWLFASCAGFLVSLQHGRFGKVLWGSSLGVSLALLWLTREEGPWVLPSLVIVLVYAGYRVVDKPGARCLRGLAVLLIPVTIFFVGVFAVSFLNYTKFGVFGVSEQQARPMQEAFGALTRVKHQRWQQKVLLPKETRERIYQVSPAFAEMRDYLEGAGGAAWAQISAYTLEEGTKSEVSGGWLMWAIRGGAESLGYHDSAPGAMAYYSRIAREINGACEQQRLECLPERASVVAPWRSEYWALLPASFLDSLTSIASYRYVIIEQGHSTGNWQTQQFFAEVTHNRLAPLAGGELPGGGAPSGGEASQLDIMRKLLACYQAVVPVLFVLALFCYLANLGTEIVSRRISILTVLNTVLLTAVVVRLGILSYLQITGFSTPRYWTPLYPLILIIGLLPIIHSGSLLKKPWRR